MMESMKDESRLDWSSPVAITQFYPSINTIREYDY